MLPSLATRTQSNPIVTMSVAVTALTPFETPSSTVANTVGLDGKPLDLTQKVTEVSNPVVADEEGADDSRQRFVGDVDLDEKDEPLLKESKRRFVLFPIQYNEVRTTRTFRGWAAGY